MNDYTSTQNRIHLLERLRDHGWRPWIHGDPSQYVNPETGELVAAFDAIEVLEDCIRGMYERYHIRT